MRFLLTKAAKKAATAAASTPAPSGSVRVLKHTGKKLKKSQALSASAGKPHPNTTHNAGPATAKVWGQQCSLKCGCVVRFELDVDDQNVVQSSQYHAKTIMSSQTDNGKLQPQKTWSRHDPSRNGNTIRSRQPQQQGQVLLKECNCETLHSLASQVVQHMPGKTLAELRNQLEFTGTRSSLAFQHAVLRTHGLAETDAHCFDVMEDSLVSLLKGYMPQPRRRKYLKQQEQHRPRKYGAIVSSPSSSSSSSSNSSASPSSEFTKQLQYEFQPPQLSYDQEFQKRYQRAIERIARRNNYANGIHNSSSSSQASRLPYMPMGIHGIGDDASADWKDGKNGTWSWWSLFWDSDESYRSSPWSIHREYDVHNSHDQENKASAPVEHSSQASASMDWLSYVDRLQTELVKQETEAAQAKQHQRQQRTID